MILHVFFRESELRVYTRLGATSKLGVREYTMFGEIHQVFMYNQVFMYRVGPGPYMGPSRANEKIHVKLGFRVWFLCFCGATAPQKHENQTLNPNLSIIFFVGPSLGNAPGWKLGYTTG